MSKNQHLNELLSILRNGQFEQKEFVIVLPSGMSIWTANDGYGLKFYPKSGKPFTYFERRKIYQAIKEGRLKQALDK